MTTINSRAGGVEPGESDVDALIRETAEEAGLTVVPDSIREYGYVHRIQKSTAEKDEYFIQDNYYYICDVEEGVRPQKLGDYESEEHFTLEYVTGLSLFYTDHSSKVT